MTFFLILTLVLLWNPRSILRRIKSLAREWYDDLLFKLKQNGVSGNLLRVIKNLFSDRVQRVTLIDKTSDWECIQERVSQGSILGPLFSLR